MKKREERTKNKEINRVRVKIERVIGWMKGFKIFGYSYRNAKEIYEKIIQAIAGLVNVRIIG